MMFQKSRSSLNLLQQPTQLSDYCIDESGGGNDDSDYVFGDGGADSSDRDNIDDGGNESGLVRALDEDNSHNYLLQSKRKFFGIHWFSELDFLRH